MKSIDKLKRFSSELNQYSTILFINTCTSTKTVFLMKTQAELLQLPVEMKINSKDHKQLLKLADKFSDVLHTKFVGSDKLNINDILT